MKKDIKCSLGLRVSIKGDFVEIDPNGPFVELDHGDHHAAAIIVWRMSDDEISPEREEFARRLVASYNECAHIDLTQLESGKNQSVVQENVMLRMQLDSATNREELWEKTMMQLVGEDGPASVAEAIEALKLQRDTAWRELAAIRKAINANPEESTLDEVIRTLSTKGTQP